MVSSCLLACHLLLHFRSFAGSTVLSFVATFVPTRFSTLFSLSTLCAFQQLRCFPVRLKPVNNQAIPPPQERQALGFPSSVSQPFRYATTVGQMANLAGPMGRNLGDRPRRPFGHDYVWLLVKEWVRVPTGQETNGHFSMSPRQRHRSRPRLQSNLDRSSNATGTSVKTAYDMWSDDIDHQIFWRAPPTHLRRENPLPPAPEAVRTC